MTPKPETMKAVREYIKAQPCTCQRGGCPRCVALDRLDTEASQRCVCGNPSTLGIVHRKDGPCYHAPEHDGATGYELLPSACRSCVRLYKCPVCDSENGECCSAIDGNGPSQHREAFDKGYGAGAIAESVRHEETLAKLQAAEDREAVLTKERDTLQRTTDALADRLKALRNRLPVCPPCEIGEDSPCICEEPLVPKVYLDETADRALKAEDREAKLAEALEAVVKWVEPSSPGVPQVCPVCRGWNPQQQALTKCGDACPGAIGRATLAAHKKVDG